MYATRRSKGWHRPSVVSLLAVLPLLLHACGGEPEEAETVPSGPPVVIEVADAGFSVPESVLHDADRNRVLVPVFRENRLVIREVR